MLDRRHRECLSADIAFHSNVFHIINPRRHGHQDKLFHSKYIEATTALLTCNTR